MEQDSSFPAIDELNAMSVEAFGSAISPLVEGAPRFLMHLADARPFTSDAAMLDAMHGVASSMTEEEQLELIEAHPRVGADAATMSALSRTEQGVDGAAGETSYVAEELANLNELYERRFGFRYVVFIAGRPPEAVIPLMEAALRNEREAELRRAVHDAIYIAGDRLKRLRPVDAGDEEDAE
jgi:2-oxo-4-hydroxy-4-carboxy--5-ureidoimidazoline (OHCU) decarboxylase